VLPLRVASLPPTAPRGISSRMMPGVSASPGSLLAPTPRAVFLPRTPHFLEKTSRLTPFSTSELIFRKPIVSYLCRRPLAWRFPAVEGFLLSRLLAVFSPLPRDVLCPLTEPERHVTLRFSPLSLVFEIISSTTFDGFPVSCVAVSSYGSVLLGFFIFLCLVFFFGFFFFVETFTPELHSPPLVSSLPIAAIPLCADTPGPPRSWRFRSEFPLETPPNQGHSAVWEHIFRGMAVATGLL